MNTTPRIGFIGFGEAGYHLAKGLRQAGIEDIAAYDIQSTDQIRQRAAETRTALAASNAGQANVDAWRSKGEDIQFPETRAYVSRVERLKGIYARAYRSQLGLG